MKIHRLISASLLVFVSLTSLSANALSITYIGPEDITEEIDTSQEAAAHEDPDLLFSKKELKVIGQREVMKGVCRSGHRVKVIQTEKGWVAEGPHPVSYTPSLSPADMAFLACGEAVPSFARIKPANAPSVSPSTSSQREEQPRKAPERVNTSLCESFSKTTLACVAKTFEVLWGR